MKSTIKIVLLLISFIGIIAINSSVYAATAAISATKTTATVGENVNINVNFTAAAWELSVSGEGVASTKYVDVTSDAENATTSKSIPLDTSSAGTKTIKLTGSVSDGTTGETKKINASVTVTINPKQETPPNTNDNQNASSQKATITKLVVGDKTYKNPAKDISISVNNSVSSVKIAPTISNGESYTINGGKSDTVKLETGTNKVTIKLASGNSYIVRISRLPKDEEVKPNVIEEPKNQNESKENKEQEKLKLTSLKIQGYELNPEFDGETYSYKVDKQIPTDVDELKVEGKANKDGATIEIVGNTSLREGENIISVIVKFEDETVSYQIVVNKEKLETMPASIGITSNQELKRIPRWNTKEKILICTFTSIIALMGIAYAVIEYRYSENKSDVELAGNISLPVDDDLIVMQTMPEMEAEETTKSTQNIILNDEKTFENDIARTKSKGKHF